MRCFFGYIFLALQYQQRFQEEEKDCSGKEGCEGCEKSGVVNLSVCLSAVELRGIL
jgi:hypothetical protein